MENVCVSTKLTSSTCAIAYNADCESKFKTVQLRLRRFRVRNESWQKDWQLEYSWFDVIKSSKVDCEQSLLIELCLKINYRRCATS